MAEPEPVTAETLAAVFARCRGEMTGKARKLLEDAGVPASVADADDIVSNAFTTALRDPAAVRQPRAYLYKLIRTEIVHLSARLAEHRRLDEKRTADPLCCTPPSVADFSALVDNRDAVHRAVRGLSVPQRTAVWATHALDYTRDETAALMGRHPGTVARHSTRAMALLRACITAVIVGASIVLGLATGGKLRHTSPADGPRKEPVLPSDQWWSENWMAVVSALVIGACVVTVLRRGNNRLARRLADAVFALVRLGDRWGTALRGRVPGLRSRNTAPPSMTVTLCADCHRRMDSGGLTQDERDFLSRQAERTPQGPRTTSACQLCGRMDSLAAPLESAHIVPLHGGGWGAQPDRPTTDGDGTGSGRPSTAFPLTAFTRDAGGPPETGWLTRGGLLIDEDDL